MTRRRVGLAPAASADVVDLIESILVASGLERAIATNARIDEALASLEEHASRGRVVPELRDRGVTTFREIVVDPYRIVFRVKEKEVWVVAVVDHRRDLDTLLLVRARRG